MSDTEPTRLSGFDPIPPEAVAKGPPWYELLPSRSRQRIGACDTVAKAQVQATTEVVILLHSIRRIMIWVMVILPIAVAVLVAVLMAIQGGASDPAVYYYP